MNEKRKYLVPALLLLGFVLSRVPGWLPVNFSAAYALVFCAGAFPQRLRWWVSFSVMLVTDVCLSVFYYHTAGFSDYQAVNYLAYALIYFLGRQFNRRSSIPKLVGGGLLGAIIFYFITNTASWLWNYEYTKTFIDWLRALTVGEPGYPETWTFFRNTLLGGGLFTGIIAALLQNSEAPEPEEPEEAAEEAPAETAAEEEKA